MNKTNSWYSDVDALVSTQIYTFILTDNIIFKLRFITSLILSNICNYCVSENIAQRVK